MQIEARMVHEPVSVRADEDGKKLEGYAAVFNRETVIGDFFREVIAPGAFTQSIKDGDVRGLFNHSPDWVLGRTSAGTMRLVEDEVGLRYVIDHNPADPDHVRATAKIERGDVTGSSFGFTVPEDGQRWERGKDGMLPLRTITRVDWLRDVGPVTFPAYEETSVQARDAASAAAVPMPVGDVGALSRARAALDIVEAEC